jgi:hypothetical protein
MMLDWGCARWLCRPKHDSLEHDAIVDTDTVVLGCEPF